LNEKRNNNLVWWVLGGLVVLLCCCLLFMVGTGGLLFGLLTTSSSQEFPAVVTVEVQQIPETPARTPASQGATPTPRTQATPEPGSSLPDLGPASLLTEQQLQEAVVPSRDLRTLAERLRGAGPIPEIVRDTPPVYRVGDSDTFWVSNEDTGEHGQIEANLVYMNDVLYIWVEEGVRYDLDQLQRAADKFADET
jgi:hypothetical protein